MDKTEEELAEIMHLFYVKHELTAAGITFKGLSNSGILELYNTLFRSRSTPRREGEQINRRIKSKTKYESEPEDEVTNPKSNSNADQSTNRGSGGTGDQPTNPGNGDTVDQSTNPCSSVSGDQPTNPGNGDTVDQSMKLETSGTVDQSTNSGNGGTGDRSTNPGINGSLSSFSKRKGKNGSHIDNSIDVFNSVPNYLIPLEPASIPPRYNSPPYCNKECNNTTQEEKADHLVNYHFMLKMEKEYYQSLSKHQVRCGSPTRSKVHKVNPNTNLIKSFKGILTDLSYLKQENEYQTYIFSVNSNNFEPQPQSSNQPDEMEESSCDENQSENVIPSAGNFGLNDLLNLAVLDDPPTTLSSWIDRQINTSPHSTPHRYQYEPICNEAGPSRKRSCSPEDKNVKRNKVSETSTVRQRVQDSVRVEAGPSNVDMAVPGSSRGTSHSSNPMDDLPFLICTYCHHWFENDKNVNHFCPSPVYSESD